MTMEAAQKVKKGARRPQTELANEFIHDAHHLLAVRLLLYRLAFPVLKGQCVTVYESACRTADRRENYDF